MGPPDSRARRGGGGAAGGGVGRCSAGAGAGGGVAARGSSCRRRAGRRVRGLVLGRTRMKRRSWPKGRPNVQKVSPLSRFPSLVLEKRWTDRTGVARRECDTQRR